jgi:hypothetical protein
MADQLVLESEKLLEVAKVAAKEDATKSTAATTVVVPTNAQLSTSALPPKSISTKSSAAATITAPAPSTPPQSMGSRIRSKTARISLGFSDLESTVKGIVFFLSFFL